jgi:hypothetical protein
MFDGTDAPLSKPETCVVADEPTSAGRLGMKLSTYSDENAAVESGPELDDEKFSMLDLPTMNPVPAEYRGNTLCYWETRTVLTGV